MHCPELPLSAITSSGLPKIWLLSDARLETNFLVMLTFGFFEGSEICFDLGLIIFFQKIYMDDKLNSNFKQLFLIIFLVFLELRSPV